MQSQARRLALSPVLLACGLLFTSQSHAISFERLAADGSGSGSFYVPLITDWVFAPDAVASSVQPSSGGWQIDLDPSSFGTSESSNQTSGIYGAGLVLPTSDFGWRVSFDANLRTWDSYNDGSLVQPNPGGNIGHWDLFAVNANSSNFYWNLVGTGNAGGGVEVPTLAPTALPGTGTGTGISGLIDPLLPNQPAGSVVNYQNSGNDSAYLPGNTWAWGGRDYAAGYFESVRTSGSVLVAPGGAQHISFVLDTRTPSDNDNNYPSWGRFGVVGETDDVPDGANGEGPGGSAANPVLPIGQSPEGVFEFAPIVVTEDSPGMTGFLFIDPEVAVGYEYTLGGGSKYKEILLPTLGDKDGYIIEVKNDQGEWEAVAVVSEGDSYEFADGVTTFRLVDISPDLGLNPANPAAFILGVKLDSPSTALFGIQVLTAAAVPEPGTYLLMGAGLLALAGVRRLRR